MASRWVRRNWWKPAAWKRPRMGDLRPLLARLTAWERFTVVPPLEIHQTTHGKWLTIDDDASEFIATLIGSGPGYSWSAAEFSKTGSVADGTGAYALNGETGLGTQKAWLRRSAVGDYRFEWNRFGWCHRTYCLTLTGLSDDAPVEGATVEFLDAAFGGTVLASITTGTDGRACITPYPAGTQSIRISYETPRGTITSDQFRFTRGGACDIEEEYTLCYSRACVNVIDENGDPIGGLFQSTVANPVSDYVSMGATCANDFYSSTWKNGLTGESPSGTYCWTLWRIQPKSRTCTGPITVVATANHGMCYRAYQDDMWTRNGVGLASGTLSCGGGWSGEITLKRVQVSFDVYVASLCASNRGTVEFVASVTDYDPQPGTIDQTRAQTGEFGESVFGLVRFPPKYLLPNPATYTVAVTPTTPGYATLASQTFTLDCADFEYHGYVNPKFLLELDPDYACGCCDWPVKKILHYSDDYGVCTLTWNPTGGPYGTGDWEGSYTFTPAVVRSTADPFNEFTACTVTDSTAVTIHISLFCDAGWRVRKTFQYCTKAIVDAYGVTHYFSDHCVGFCTEGEVNATVVLDCNTYGPLSLSFNLSSPDLNVPQTMGPGTITE